VEIEALEKEIGLKKRKCKKALRINLRLLN